ncbi:hypothetical protein [Dokdonella sp.]|uniref:hypothetical protein n=1 Tax=Dokdonella sp. TaxID=2291710 RepID=UPI0025BF4464|nr:hypothetical protein [Dokdonella sp.]
MDRLIPEDGTDFDSDATLFRRSAGVAFSRATAWPARALICAKRKNGPHEGSAKKRRLLRLNR